MSDPSIVQVTLWNSPYLGNFMLSMMALAGAARERFGLRSHFVLSPPDAEEPAWLRQLDDAGIGWSILPRPKRSWRAHLEGVARERDAALIDTHFTHADRQAAGIAAAAGIPCVWHLRTGFNGYPPAQRVKDVYKMRLVARRRVARLIAVSPWLAELAERRGAPRRRIETVPDAIASGRFVQLPDRATARERFGLDPDAVVILGLGWWPSIKGVDLFVDAIGSFAERHPNVNALLVGERDMRSFLSERLPSQPPWLRLSGFVEDSAWLFAAADVFVSASRAEGQSSAVGEALACGVPVVMSDIPGTSLWGGAPGVSTFASEQTQLLAAELQALVERSPQERATLGAENREWLQRNYSIDRWCERICSIYAELL